jgi:hypothetical protein
MPSSYGRSIAIAVFVFVLTVSPYAHAADTSAFGINDPFTDAIQLWSAVLASIDALPHLLASAFASHNPLAASTIASTTKRSSAEIWRTASAPSFPIFHRHPSACSPPASTTPANDNTPLSATSTAATSSAQQLRSPARSF